MPLLELRVREIPGGLSPKVGDPSGHLKEVGKSTEINAQSPGMGYRRALPPHPKGDGSDGFFPADQVRQITTAVMTSAIARDALLVRGSKMSNQITGRHRGACDW